MTGPGLLVYPLTVNVRAAGFIDVHRVVFGSNIAHRGTRHGSAIVEYEVLAIDHRDDAVARAHENLRSFIDGRAVRASTTICRSIAGGKFETSATCCRVRHQQIVAIEIDIQ